MTNLHKVLDAQSALLKTPTTGTGAFEAIIATWAVDRDNERFDRHAFDEQDGAKIPVSYQHAIHGDPNGVIGWAIIHPTDEGLVARGQLDLKGENSAMAAAIYERMLLPPQHPRALKEFSVGFAAAADDTTIGLKGERVFMKATVIEVSVVHRGAQIGAPHLLQSKLRDVTAIQRSKKTSLLGRAGMTQRCNASGRC